MISLDPNPWRPENAPMPRLLLHCCRVFTTLLACCTLLHASPGLAAAWREIQSPHFRVVTDGSEHDGRDVAKEFEQMRSVFETRFKNGAIDPAAPLLVMAVREPGLHELAPALWKDRERTAGEFFTGWERQYAFVRLDNVGDNGKVVVFHEYAHSILHANVHWLPVWLDEGMAEFYGYTRVEGDRVLIGAPSMRLRHLRSEPLIPVPEMLTANYRTFAKDQQRNDLFYGEAWATVHFMQFGPDMGEGAKFNRFIAALQTGTPQMKAFQEVFGDPQAFERKLSSYIAGFAFTAAVLPPSQKLDAKSFAAKVLAPAELDYELGSFDLGARDPVEAKKRLVAAETADPTLAGPHEELGFLAWSHGQDDEARSEWQKAVAADPARYRAAFALLMSTTVLKDQSEQQLEQTQHALEVIQEKAPKFAPVLVELALIQWRLGHLNAAYKTAVAAERLEPWRAGYHLLSGYILLQGNQPKLAADYARMVATSWPGSDHDEAVDLWTHIPISARGEGTDLSMAIPEKATLTRGTVVSSSCDKSSLSVTLQPSTPNATALKLTTSGRYESGFSDTLWFGRDHFTPCYHLAGLPAVVAYTSDGTGSDKLVALEIRDYLPELSLSTSVSSSAPGGIGH